jgi:hypothetical protein
VIGRMMLLGRLNQRWNMARTCSTHWGGKYTQHRFWSGVLTVTTMKNITPCSSLEVHRSFDLLPWRWRQYASRNSGEFYRTAWRHIPEDGILHIISWLHNFKGMTACGHLREDGRTDPNVKLYIIELLFSYVNLLASEGVVLSLVMGQLTAG